MDDRWFGLGDRGRYLPIAMIRSQFLKLIAKLPEDARNAFLPPPTENQLIAASNALAERNPNAKLPDDVIELYRACGGQPWETKYEHELFPMFSLNPIERAISDYREICDLYEFDAKPYESEGCELPNTWWDYRLFPFGWAPGSGTVHGILVDTGQIYDFNPDGGIYKKQFESIADLIEKSIEFQKDEFGR